MWAYVPVSPKVVIVVSCYLLYGVTEPEHLAVQMDVERTGQRKLITAYFPSICRVCRGPICSAKKSHKLWLQIERGFISTLLFPGLTFSYTLVSVCVRAHTLVCVCPWLCDSCIGKCQTPRALNVSSRPPHHHDRVSCLWERRLFLSRRWKETRVCITCFSLLNGSDLCGSGALIPWFIKC